MALSTRFEDALTYATRLHAAQVRKASDVPYMAHLLAVTSIVLEYGGDEDEAIAALLHDAIEDQGGEPTHQEIRRRFGDRVADIVDGCSDARTIPKPAWRERKEAFLGRIPSMSSSVRLVIAADKLHNLRSMLADYRIVREALWSRFSGGREGTLWNCRATLDALRRAGETPLLEELGRVVNELEGLAAEHAPAPKRRESAP